MGGALYIELMHSMIHTKQALHTFYTPLLPLNLCPVTATQYNVYMTIMLEGKEKIAHI